MTGFLIYIPVVILAGAIGIATRQKDNSIRSAEQAHYDSNNAKTSLGRIVSELEYADTPDMELVNMIAIHVNTVYSHCESTGNTVEYDNHKASVCDDTGELKIEEK